jgi:hypothetical protein
MTAIYHYYHIYADGEWQTPVREHIEALQKSKLHEETDFLIRIGLVGSEANVNRVQEYLEESEIKWKLVIWRTTGWEQLTLGRLASDSQDREGLAFYGHTKGAHDPNRFNEEWRQRMTYFTVTRWRDAVEALRTHDAYGCHWMELQGNWIFGGNFWWTHMHYLRLLPQPGNENRWRAEDWIGQLRHHISNFRVCDPAPPFPGEIG